MNKYYDILKYKILAEDTSISKYQTVDEGIESRIIKSIYISNNYEELIQKLSPEEKTGVLARIDKTVFDWASSTGGLVIKNERDTYVYVFEQRYLAEIEKSKINILDLVKEIDAKVPITLSISISNEENTYYDRYKSALDGLELVLGRGGDQCIVRKEGKYKFYGGKSLEVEKRTIVATDLGMNLGKFVDTLKETEYEKIIIDKKEALSLIDKDTLLIVVDTHKKSFVQVPELLDKTEKIVVIDHHRKGPDFIENASLTFQEVYASSAAELVTEILQYVERKVELTPIEIESLYGGIMVDTKNFTFKTGVRTFEAAAYLRRFGVDIIKVKKWFQADLESYNVIADIVKKADMVSDTIAISTYDEVSKDANTICAKAADELLTISDITASFVIGNNGENICISGRSIGDINVQIILEKMGGGGHITLAGAQLTGVTIDEAKTELMNRINEYFSEISE